MLEPKPNVSTAVPVQRALYQFQTLQVPTDSGAEPPLLCIVYFPITFGESKFSS